MSLGSLCTRSVKHDEPMIRIVRAAMLLNGTSILRGERHVTFDEHAGQLSVFSCPHRSQVFAVLPLLWHLQIAPLLRRKNIRMLLAARCVNPFSFRMVYALAVVTSRNTHWSVR